MWHYLIFLGRRLSNVSKGSGVSVSPNYQKAVISDQLSIDGSVSTEQLEFLQRNYKGLLYVATDKGEDVGLVRTSDTIIPA
jgi:hypothetical protein